MLRYHTALFLLLAGFSMLPAQVLNLPARNPAALNGTQFIATINSPTLSLTNREDLIYTQISGGNVPSFYRNLVPVTSSAVISGVTQSLTYYVAPDYLMVGTDTNYFLCPMSPMLATKIADFTGCTLPSRKMVNDIYAAATVKLAPQPIPPSSQMSTVPVFTAYNDSVRKQRDSVIVAHPLGELTGGDKKDVTISNLIYTTANRVVIYGWHTSIGNPIQPLSNIHADTYMDYSHGIRLVQNSCVYNGTPTTIKDILISSTLNTLLSDEGSMAQPQYPYDGVIPSTPASFAVLRGSSTTLQVLVSNDTAVTGYNIYLSTDGINFNAPVLLPKTSLLLTGLTPNTVYYVKLSANNSITGLTSGISFLLAATTSSQADSTLLVYGFDRVITGNTYNWVIQHGQAFAAGGKIFSSATHQAIENHLLPLTNYAIADYILGEESTANQTFSDTDQVLFAAYLNQGGHLFASGSEIAWDLDKNGTTADRSFFNNYLKSSFIADSPNNLVSTYYSDYTSVCPSSIFSGSDSITFDNGTHGTYNVGYPDVVSVVNGGIPDMHYATSNTDYGGVHFAGLFPGGTKPGKMMYLCFPFETIYPIAARDTVMAHIIRFFDGNLGLISGLAGVDENAISLKLYPNPVAGEGLVQFSLPKSDRVSLTLYDASGRSLRTLADQDFQQGVQRVGVNREGLPPGLYFIHLLTSSTSATVSFLVVD